MHHVAVTFDDHHVGDFHRPIAGDAANIVAAEIDEHHVLGTFLGIGQQFLGESLVFVFVATAGPRSGERPDGHASIDDPDHDFGRTADERYFGRAQIEHERTGIHNPQSPIHLKRRRVDPRSRDVG